MGDQAATRTGAQAPSIVNYNIGALHIPGAETGLSVDYDNRSVSLIFTFRDQANNQAVDPEVRNLLQRLSVSGPAQASTSSNPGPSNPQGAVQNASAPSSSRLTPPTTPDRAPSAARCVLPLPRGNTPIAPGSAPRAPPRFRAPSHPINGPSSPPPDVRRVTPRRRPSVPETTTEDDEEPPSQRIRLTNALDIERRRRRIYNTGTDMVWFFSQSLCKLDVPDPDGELSPRVGFLYVHHYGEDGLQMWMWGKDEVQWRRVHRRQRHPTLDKYVLDLRDDGHPTWITVKSMRKKRLIERAAREKEDPALEVEEG